MTTRKIATGPGWSNIGTAANQPSRAKKRKIKTLLIYPTTERKSHNIVMQCELEDGSSQPTISLPPNAAIEVVKGLLQNLHPLWIGGDDELLQLLKIAEAEARQDAEGVLQALEDRLTPSEKENL